MRPLIDAFFERVEQTRLAQQHGRHLATKALRYATNAPLADGPMPLVTRGLPDWPKARTALNFVR